MTDAHVDLVIVAVAVFWGYGAGIALVAGFHGFRCRDRRGMARRYLDLLGIGVSIFVAYAAFPAAMGVESLPNRERYIGLAIAYVAGAGYHGFALWRESSRSTHEKFPEATRGGPSARWLRFRRAAIRTLEYLFGLGICGWALYIGTLASTGAERWALGNIEGISDLAITAIGVVAGFVYGQLVTAQAIKVLNIAVEHDWAVSRRNHYLLAAGPFIYVISIVPDTPGIAAGICVQLVTLAVGYRFTSDRPTGPLKTVRAVAGRLLAQRRQVAD